MSNDFDPQVFGKVAVLYGGTNSEREVSLESGAAVYAACHELGLDCVAMDIGQSPIQQLQESHIDWAFNILHGGMGEDGTMSTLLDALGIRYCSSAALASGLSMNKTMSKHVWRSVGLPVPDGVEIDTDCEDPMVRIEKQGLQLPLVLKPPLEGSSIGVSIVRDKSQLQQVLERDVPIYKKLMVEEYINGQEITVTILGDQALPAIRIEVGEGFYDYHAKYVSQSTKMYIPCGLSAGVEKKIQTMAVQAFRALGCRVWGRVDFMVTEEGEPYLLEANTLPGMTSHSLVPRAAKEIGLSFPDLIRVLLSYARDAYKKR